MQNDSLFSDITFAHTRMYTELGKFATVHTSPKLRKRAFVTKQSLVLYFVERKPIIRFPNGKASDTCEHNLESFFFSAWLVVPTYKIQKYLTDLMRLKSQRSYCLLTISSPKSYSVLKKQDHSTNRKKKYHPITNNPCLSCVMQECVCQDWCYEFQTAYWKT